MKRSSRNTHVEPMRFYPEAYKALVSTVGALPPETGGLLFGDRDGPDAYVIKKFVLDTSGHRSRVSYDPDPVEVNRIVRKVWQEEGLALIGWAHSHPRGVSQLSGDYGNGTGDLGYLRAIFNAMPKLETFLVPILHSTDDGALVVHPYVARRVNVAGYQKTTLEICAPTPKRPAAFDRAILDEKITGAVDPKRLKKTHVFAVGVGGANGIYENLIRMGVSHLSVIDFDKVDASNLVTQGWFADQIGMPKVEAFKETAKRLVPRPACIDETLSCLDADFLKLDDDSLLEMAKDADLLLFMTDNFHAQARGNRLALKLQKPAIFASMYEGATCTEITFMIPGVTPACHRCAVSTRYDAYLKRGYRNDVTSQGSFIFQTEALNSLIGLLAMAILHHDTQGTTFSGWFGQYWDRTLIQTRLNPHHKSALFDRVFGSQERCHTFDSIWQRIEAEAAPKNTPCPDCGGHGDLTKATIGQTRLSATLGQEDAA